MRGPPLESEYSNVGPPEGRVAEGVAEGVDGGVDVAEAVGDLPHQLGDDPVTLLGAQDPLYSSYFYNTETTLLVNRRSRIWIMSPRYCVAEV